MTQTTYHLKMVDSWGHSLECERERAAKCICGLTALQGEARKGSSRGGFFSVTVHPMLLPERRAVPPVACQPLCHGTQHVFIGHSLSCVCGLERDEPSITHLSPEPEQHKQDRFCERANSARIGTRAVPPE